MQKLIIIILSFSLSACDQSAVVYDKLSEGGVILAFGDSLTRGIGASQQADYPTVLSELSSHEVVNAGVSGEITRNGLTRLPALLDKYQPELLVLIHGGNDMLRKIPEQRTYNNLQKMIELAQQRNIKVVMLGVPKPSILLRGSAEIYQQLAEQHQVPIDMETISTILRNKALKSDTVHPNDAGYQLLAEHVFELLVETGAL